MTIQTHCPYEICKEIMEYSVMNNPCNSSLARTCKKFYKIWTDAGFWEKSFKRVFSHLTSIPTLLSFKFQLQMLFILWKTEKQNLEAKKNSLFEKVHMLHDRIQKVEQNGKLWSDALEKGTALQSPGLLADRMLKRQSYRELKEQLVCHIGSNGLDSYYRGNLEHAPADSQLGIVQRQLQRAEGLSTFVDEKYYKEFITGSQPD